MAEKTKPINQLVERIVRILSKRKTDDLDFSEIGTIKAFAYSQDEDGEYEYNYFDYDPSSIESFFETYEETLKIFNMNKFIHIGRYEMLSGRYK
jgi:hypothetical protein